MNPLVADETALPVRVMDWLLNLPEWVSNALSRAVSSAVDAAQLYVLALLGVCVVVCGTAMLLRRGGARRSLSDRERTLLRPSDSFDPSIEEILRFAGQLSRVHSTTRRWLRPRSSQTIRIRLVSAGSGQMAYVVEVPKAAGGLLRTRGFPDVEVSDVEGAPKAAVRVPPVVGEPETSMGKWGSGAVAGGGSGPTGSTRGASVEPAGAAGNRKNSPARVGWPPDSAGGELRAMKPNRLNGDELPPARREER